MQESEKIFTDVGKKNREETGMLLFEEGEQIGSFGQNIYPWPNSQHVKSAR